MTLPLSLPIFSLWPISTIGHTGHQRWQSVGANLPVCLQAIITQALPPYFFPLLSLPLPIYFETSSHTCKWSVLYNSFNIINYWHTCDTFNWMPVAPVAPVRCCSLSSSTQSVVHASVFPNVNCQSLTW